MAKPKKCVWCGGLASVGWEKMECRISNVCKSPECLAKRDTPEKKRALRTARARAAMERRPWP